MKHYSSEYDSIVWTMACYFEGERAGRSNLMRPACHPTATIAGYRGGTLLTGPIEQLFEWIDENGPAPHIEPRFAAIDITGTVAVVRCEVEHRPGKPADGVSRRSDILTLLKTGEGWKISQTSFHWHCDKS